VLILRTAANCGTDYEWGHHVDLARFAGLDADEIASLSGPHDRATAVDALLVTAATSSTGTTS